MLEHIPHYPQDPQVSEPDDRPLTPAQETGQINQYMATIAELGSFPQSDPDVPIATLRQPWQPRPLGRHTPKVDTGTAISQQIAQAEAAQLPPKTEEQILSDRLSGKRGYKLAKASLHAAIGPAQHDALMKSVADIPNPEERQHQLDAILLARADRAAEQQQRIDDEIARLEERLRASNV